MTTGPPAPSLNDQLPLVPSRVNGGAFLPISMVFIVGSAFYGFENGIQVEVVAEIHELLAQHADVQPARHVHDHLYREHQRTGMRSGVRAGRQFRDVHAALRKESGETRDDARLVEAHDVDGVGQHDIARGALFGPPQLNVHAGGIGEFLELALELRESVPIAVHQQQHGELVAERGHAAFADAAAAVGYRLGEFVDHADAVPAHRGNHDMLFHRPEFYRM